MAVDYDKEKNLLKLYFEPSTIETIDAAMLKYVQKLNLFTETNEGYKRVPVIWAGSERGFQSKRESEIRDKGGMLKYPLITVVRKNIDKSFAKRAAFHGNIPGYNDEQGGSLSTHRVINQEKTKNFARSGAFNLTGDPNARRINNKIVYRTISAPMPVNVVVNYDIMIRTEYQQQMNDLVIPFMTMPGTVNAINVQSGEHRYEAFVGKSITQNSNISNYGSEERRFDTTVPIEVIGYLVGEGPNREKPYYAIRENAVEVKIPRERISLSEIPEHEYGKYYGLSGTGPLRSMTLAPLAALLSNVPAVGAGSGGGSGEHAHDAYVSKAELEATIKGLNLIQNITNQTITEVFAFREVLKESGTPPPEGLPPVSRSFTAANKIKQNSETVFKNRILQTPGLGWEYTVVDSQTIVFNEDVNILDDIYISYLKED